MAGGCGDCLERASGRMETELLAHVCCTSYALAWFALVALAAGLGRADDSHACSVDALRWWRDSNSTGACVSSEAASRAMEFYAWTPFLYLCQAVLALLPGWMWCWWEGGFATRVSATLGDESSGGFLSRVAFLRRCVLKCNRRKYAAKLFFCVFLHFALSVLQVLVTDQLSGGALRACGRDWLAQWLPGAGPGETEAACVLPADPPRAIAHMLAWLWLHAARLLAGLALLRAFWPDTGCARRLAVRRLFAAAGADERHVRLVTRELGVGGVYLVRRLAAKLPPHVLQPLLEFLAEGYVHNSSDDSS